MKSRRLLALLFGSCFLFALAPTVAWAQGPTTGGTPTGGSPSGTPANSTPVSTTSATVKSSLSGAGSATSIASNTNPFVQTYGDPLSMGKPANYATTVGPPKQDTVTFGKGIYSTTAGAVSSSASTVTNPASGFTLYNVYRNPSYATALSSELPLVVHSASALQGNLRSILDRSSYLRNPRAVQVRAGNGIVRLTGQVASDKERRLVEGMVRTTPGVANVLNDLKVVPKN